MIHRFSVRFASVLLAIALCAVCVPISAVAAEGDVYNVSVTSANSTSDAPATIADGNDLFITFTADDGYLMPETITVTVGGEELAATDYRYGPSVTLNTASLLLVPEQITGDIVITADAVKGYTVRIHGESWSAAIPVYEGQSVFGQYGEMRFPSEKDGHTFGGFFESADGGETLTGDRYDFNTPVTADVTLYPLWTPIEDTTTTTTVTETTTTEEVVTTTTASAATTTLAQSGDRSPQTGHSHLVLIAVTLVLTAAVGLTVTLKKVTEN